MAQKELEYLEDHYIKNVGDYLTGNFEKIDGFDFRWHTLVTNKPLLFEDIDYIRVMDFVDNTVTDNERIAYINGDLKEMYATFENMLFCNLHHYDRIMSFCTMIFLHYVKIDGNTYTKGLDSIPYELSMTPTKIWCAALSNVDSTEWELNYAWGINNKKLTIPPIEDSTKSIFETSYHNIYRRNKTFAKFMEYSAARVEGNGFRETYFKDRTSNTKLAQICSKFTKSGNAFSENQLKSLSEYFDEVESHKKEIHLVLNNCLDKLFNGDPTQYYVYIFNDEIFIYTVRFSLKIFKNEKGQISKDYLANSYECFLAEEFLIPSVRSQIEWIKYKQPVKYMYDKKVLENILFNLLTENFRTVVAVKEMKTSKLDNDGAISKIKFKGVFAMVKIVEEFMCQNRTIRTIEKTLSKKNAAKYIIERGYYVFGVEDDVHKLLYETEMKQKDILEHYQKYCIPVITHMFEVIEINKISRNEINDFIVTGKIDDSKLNNHNIKYTSLSKIDSRELMSGGLRKQNKRFVENKKSYWRVIED